jgi:hypothetical protein
MQSRRPVPRNIREARPRRRDAPITLTDDEFEALRRADPVDAIDQAWIRDPNRVTYSFQRLIALAEQKHGTVALTSPLPAKMPRQNALNPPEGQARVDLRDGCVRTFRVPQRSRRREFAPQLSAVDRGHQDAAARLPLLL